MTETGLILLRPVWLLAVIPSLLLIHSCYRQFGHGNPWNHLIAPHLLKHLMPETQAQKTQRLPWVLLALAMVLASFALSGPSWNKQPQPIEQNKQALIILLDLSYSMYAQDIKQVGLIAPSKKSTTSYSNAKKA